MFSRRFYGGTPDSFKLILEFGREDGTTESPLQQLSGPVRLPVALATLEFEFKDDESVDVVLERFTQRKSSITFDRMEERVVLKLSVHDRGASGPYVRAKVSVACVSPTLRCVQAIRVTSTGESRKC